jgi:hypothetical protein
MRVMSVALAMSASRPLCPQERCYSGHADTAGLGRVEDGRGSLGPNGQRPVSHPRSSNRTCPIKASGSPTGFTERHAGRTNRARSLRGGCLSFVPRHSNLRQRLSLMVFTGSSPITTTSPSSKAHQKSGPFAPPALPGLNAPTTLSDSRQDRRLSRR